MTLSKYLIAGATLATALVAGSANAAYMQDNYIGKDTNWGAGHTSTDYSNTDRIGGGIFEIHGASFDLTGSTLTVIIDTNFSQNLGRNQYYGDLFISTNGYAAAGNSSNDYGVTALDNGIATAGTHGVAPGETWEYAFDTDAGQLISLAGGAEISQGTHRQGQETRIDRSGVNVNTTAVVLGNTSSFTDHGGNYNNQIGINGWNLLEYKIDLSFLGAFTKSDLAVHWTMYCGNDVFETRVPEPSSIALLSLGLLGLGVIRKKNK